MTADEVMHAREIAGCLEIENQSTCRRDGSGDMPCFRNGGSWRLRKGGRGRWAGANAAGLLEKSSRTTGERSR